ncbi:MAG: prepilin-type N-terminal cleavage/methylation domain-containing protein [Neisseriales bacterium]|nr:MAG: prepilin-type N-terminal cleavage/methylation domain-containing protein [Neisseriales bacterium]
MMRMMKKAGFTIIELMMAIAIIGIFAALAVPAYQSYVNRAKISEGYNFASYYTVAIAEYYNEKGSFPNNLGQVGTPSQDVQANYVSSVCMQNSGAFQVLFGGNPTTGALQYVPTVGASSGSVNWGCYGILIPNEWLPSQCKTTDIIYNQNGLLIINRIVNGQTKKLAYAYPCPEYQSSSTAGVLSNSSIDFVQNMYEYMRDRFGYTNDQIATVYNSYSEYLQNMQESWYVENTSGNAYQTLQCGNGYSPGYTFGYMIEIGSVVSAGVCPSSNPIIWNCQKWANGAFVVDPNSRWTCGPDHP